MPSHTSDSVTEMMLKVMDSLHYKNLICRACPTKFNVWIWKLINIEDLWKGIFACCDFTRGGRNVGEKIRYFLFLFLRILMDEIFIFVGSSFRMIEIDFDVGFIMRPTNFSFIDTPFLIILYINMKNYGF
jgi:hypothetical protein